MRRGQNRAGSLVRKTQNRAGSRWRRFRRSLTVLMIFSVLILALPGCGAGGLSSGGSAAEEGTDGYREFSAGSGETQENRGTGRTLSISEASTMSPEQEEWQEYLMPHAEQYVNVREKPSEDSAVVGKLYMGSRAHIEEKGDTWTRVESGKVIGYVMNKYCYFGDDALEWAKENCDTLATVTGEGVRVRSAESQDSDIMALVPNGQRMLVDPFADTGAGWVAVLLDGTDQTGYVRSDLIKISYKTTKAVSIEEEESSIAESKAAVEASIAAEKAAQESRDAESRAAARSQEAAAQAAADASRAQAAAAAKEKAKKAQQNSSELRLLAALIQCEAGGEPYEGQIAVGAVVMNRVRSGKFPNSIRGVIYQGGQFTPAGNGSVDRVTAAGPRSSCLKAATAAMNGTDNTGGSLYFGRSVSGTPKAVIGNHKFY
jgi:spore germination cell wall hydrolase CwlJ-like protein